LDHGEPHPAGDPTRDGEPSERVWASKTDLHLLELVELGVWLVDAGGRILLVNAAAERIHGRPRTDVLGRHFAEFLAPDRREVTLVHFRRKLEGGAALTEHETVLVRPSGRRSTIRTLSIPIRRDLRVMGVLAFAYPIVRESYMRRLPERWPALSPRRHQILRLVASGLTTAEISRELVLSEQTVRNHIRDVLRELDAHSRLEAVDIARRLGLLESEPVELEPGG